MAIAASGASSNWRSRAAKASTSPGVTYKSSTPSRTASGMPPPACSRWAGGAPSPPARSSAGLRCTKAGRTRWPGAGARPYRPDRPSLESRRPKLRVASPAPAPQRYPHRPRGPTVGAATCPRAARTRAGDRACPCGLEAAHEKQRRCGAQGVLDVRRQADRIGNDHRADARELLFQPRLPLPGQRNHPGAAHHHLADQTPPERPDFLSVELMELRSVQMDQHGELASPTPARPRSACARNWHATPDARAPVVGVQRPAQPRSWRCLQARPPACVTRPRSLRAC